jgi:hypothetical protein
VFYIKNKKIMKQKDSGQREIVFTIDNYRDSNVSAMPSRPVSAADYTQIKFQDKKETSFTVYIKNADQYFHARCFYLDVYAELTSPAMAQGLTLAKPQGIKDDNFTIINDKLCVYGSAQDNSLLSQEYTKISLRNQKNGNIVKIDINNAMMKNAMQEAYGMINDAVASLYLGVVSSSLLPYDIEIMRVQENTVALRTALLKFNTLEQKKDNLEQKKDNLEQKKDNLEQKKDNFLNSIALLFCAFQKFCSGIVSVIKKLFITNAEKNIGSNTTTQNNVLIK